ncbi:cytochrome p450 monooxygenase [Cercophora newfieldiana]|uniref:Cytochrome p450 monooxygenase n=1 Tax=Cercophora newfieldiana TaxID=92897 RepID=A0AA39YAW7_9PEZI|nr:cytochrome p450 monooxygenase [Cercophora newfieldiana]
MRNQLHLAVSALGALSLAFTGENPSVGILQAFLVIFLAIFAARATYRLWIYPNFVSPLRHLPGPKNHHFLLGHMISQFFSGNPNEPYLSWVRQWPDAEMIRYFTFGNAEAILVTGLDAFRDVLSVKPYSFVKPELYKRFLGPVVGKGLVFAEGEEHKAHRKLMAGPFALNKLKQLIPVFKEKAEHLSGYFDRAIEVDGGTVELVKTYTSITLDIIGVAALGVDLRNLDAPTPFHVCYSRTFDPPIFGQALMAIDIFVPIRWIPLEENRKYLSYSAEVHRMTLEIVRDRIRELTDENGKLVATERKDLLTFLIQETYEAENPWTEQEYLGHMLNMLAAGHETTASALQWATHALAKHPEVQTRLRSEILAMLKKTPNPGYTELENLRYLNNFSREVLRVWCPAIESPRKAAEDVLVNGVLIPKGTYILLMPSAIQLNPRIWGDDADQFRPDRWDGKIADAHAFAAFFQGPRQCIGRVFSMMEFKIILVEILSKFQFDAVETEEIVLVNPSPLLRPSGGLRAKVSRLPS